MSLPNSVRSRPIAAGSLGGMTCGVVSSGAGGAVIDSLPEVDGGVAAAV